MDPQASALLSHVLSQMDHHVQFLLEQGYISQTDANTIRAKLPDLHNTTPTPPPIAPKPRPVVVQARALWAYNEKGEDPDDLSFSQNDIVQIIEETNADWWTGKVHGKQALFPSAYVEKLPSPPAPSPPYSDKSGTGPVYQPFGAPLHGPDVVPQHTQNGVDVQQQHAAEDDVKKKGGKFGKYKSTIAHSAAGGAGFGAGAAIGGGLVRAIF